MGWYYYCLITTTTTTQCKLLHVSFVHVHNSKRVVSVKTVLDLSMEVGCSNRIQVAEEHDLHNLSLQYPTHMHGDLLQYLCALVWGYDFCLHWSRIYCVSCVARGKHCCQYFTVICHYICNCPLTFLLVNLLCAIVMELDENHCLH